MGREGGVSGEVERSMEGSSQSAGVGVCQEAHLPSFFDERETEGTGEGEGFCIV